MRTGTFVTLGALVFGIAVAGCGDDESGAASGKKSALAEIEAAVPKINQAVPAEIADALKFEAATVEDGELAAVVPSGWESKYMPGHYKPADDSDLGFMTSYSVGSNCDGMCKPKDWQAAIDKVELSQFRTGDFTIDKDEKLGANGHLLVARSSDATHIVATWSKQDASKYYYCRASLEEGAATAAVAFEQACRSTHVLAW